MRQICVASHHRALAELLADPEFRRLVQRGGFLVELRLDRYRDLSLDALRQALEALGPRRLLVTCRRPDEGGGAPNLSAAQRIAFLAEAVARRAAFVDLELKTIQEAPQAARALLAKRSDGARTRFIISFHDFQGLPPLEELRRIRSEAEAAGADLVKIAVRPKRLMDARPLLQLLGEDGGAWSRPLLALAMGEEGLWTRVLGPRFPRAAPFTFARAEKAPGTAPGQPTWRALLEEYRYRAITPKTPVYGVIGNPIRHSLSPLMHNAALAALNLEGVYLPFKLAASPEAFLRDFAGPLGLRGLSVTIPHKETVLAACASLNPVARQIGALNTLLLRENRDTNEERWFGTNTDAQAAAGSLEAALGEAGSAGEAGEAGEAGGAGALRGRTVLILGAGGAARAVAFGVKARGAEVWIHNRSAARARNLAEAVGGRCVTKEALRQAQKQADAVVNATPLGMYPKVDATPLGEKDWGKGSLIFDLVYNPLRTKFLRMAERRGQRTLGGLAMFVGQGAAQFELFTGQAAPVEVMERVVRARLNARQAEAPSER